MFDTYRSLALRPAALFALPVVRRPARVWSLCSVAATSPPARRPRTGCPARSCRPGLRLTGTEGAGEVQTPLRGAAADQLRIGDRVWFRHAKAGELCERFDPLLLIEGDAVVDEVPTYRGEGKTFL